MLTVFTPTYNRAYRLPDLYESLCCQSCNNFEWLVVDDGSSDNTGELIAQWQAEKKLSIRYIQQENGGKHRAINRGVKEASGELFFIVDSDDRLTDNAIETIYTEYQAVAGNEKYCGVCGLRAYLSGERIGGENDFGTLDCNPLDFRYVHRMQGDMAEVFRTAVLREFPFPEIPGEKFCPEAVVWQRISAKYTMRYFYKKIYLCEYLPDGLTRHIVKARMNSPVGAAICYSELMNAQVPLLIKIRASINYWRFRLCPSPHRMPHVHPLWVITFPVGLLLHLADRLKKR